ncbi:MAG: serine hydrolase domain-containing protein [Steroidobacteraceae bacterium]
MSHFHAAHCASRAPLSRLWRALSATLGLLLLAGSVTVSAQSQSLSPATAKQIDHIVLQALAKGDIPGASVAIERHGVVIYQKGFGFADLENKVPVTPQSVFPIGSITKTMTALAIQQLIAEGKVDLNAPIGRYLPRLPEPDRNVRIRYLLDHTSGIPNYTEIPGFPNGAQAPMTRQDILRWFDSRPLLFPSGTRWSYTNSGYYLLGLVIETVSGMSYDQYLRAHIFTPFGMSATTLAGWAPLVDHRAHGYRRHGNSLENAPRYDPLLPFSAGGVMSTAGDLLQYRHAVFGSGAVPVLIRNRLLQRDRLPDAFLLPYSLGGLVISRFEGHRRIGHPGDIDGFAVQYSYYPDDGLTVVILTNTDTSPFPPTSIEQKIVRILFGLSQPVIKDLPLPPATADSLRGEYAVGDMRFGFDRMAFVAVSGRLEMEIGGEGAPAIPLRYQGDLQFVSSVDDEQQIAFEGTRRGMRVIVMFYGSPLALHRISAAAH